MTETKLVLSADFLKQFARLPRHVQSRTTQLIGKFRVDPNAPGLGLEKLQKTADPNFYSVRLGDDFRAILFKSSGSGGGDDSRIVFVLLWADHHDEAYEWARNRVCRVHPDIGTLQVLEVRSGDADVAAPTPPVATTGATAGAAGPLLFDGIRDRELEKLGVPAELLPLVRSLRDETDLNRVASRFPAEAGDALYLLAAGYSVAETWRELMPEGDEAPAAVDPADVAAALDRPASRQRFAIVDSDADLQAMLHAPLAAWRVFLHPSQRRLVERHWNGPVRVLGTAGTGKTVAAVHRARWLAMNVVTDPSQRILFTTYSRNLAADIEAQLKQICGPELMKRIDVINLDRWVTQFLKQQGYDYRIAWGEESDELWRQALAVAPAGMPFEDAFYRDEWEQVIQAGGIETLEEYLQTPRLGRGTRLSRVQRRAVWEIFAQFRFLLRDRRLKAREDAIRDARQLVGQDPVLLPYRSVIVDEAQDMGYQAFQLLRAIAGPERADDLFITGDAHQRIYSRKVILGKCGIRIVGRSRTLRVNYRTTEETHRWSTALLDGIPVDDLDGGSDAPCGIRSLTRGDPPEIRRFDTFQDETAFLSARLSAMTPDELAATCVTARTKSLLAQYEGAIRAAGLAVYHIRPTEAENRSAPGVRMATMHRVKGLEFERMFLAGMNRGVVPLDVAESSADAVVRQDHNLRERALVYVAATRARRQVVITGYGEMSGLVSEG